MLLLSTLWFLSLLSLSHTATWSYTGQVDGITTNAWDGQCPTGAKQSPINLQGGTLSGFSDWQFDNYYVTGAMQIVNNGHSAQASFTDTTMATVAGGGLPGTYKFAQFHFHWGANSKRGSEHTVGGREYPLEIHFVHFNTAYDANDINLAIAAGNGAQDTLAVLGVLFHQQFKDNPALNPVIDALANIKNDGSTTALSINLQSLLPTGLCRFWRYEGSLTTPQCNEIVMWTVFKVNMISEFLYSSKY